MTNLGVILVKGMVTLGERGSPQGRGDNRTEPQAEHKFRRYRVEGQPTREQLNSHWERKPTKGDAEKGATPRVGSREASAPLTFGARSLSLTGTCPVH